MCFEGLGSDSHRAFSRFVRGSREISPVSSLYRESTDSLISRIGQSRMRDYLVSFRNGDRALVGITLVYFDI